VAKIFLMTTISDFKTERLYALFTIRQSGLLWKTQCLFPAFLSVNFGYRINFWNKTRETCNALNHKDFASLSFLWVEGGARTHDIQNHKRKGNIL